jgi:hypothetical protein
MDNIDKLLNDYMTNKPKAGVSRGVFEPSEGLWQRFFDNSLTEGESEQMSAFLLQDKDAREFALKTRKILAESAAVSSQAPKEWVAAAKNMATSKALRPKKRHLYLIWYGVAAAAFCMSFLMPRYYMQYLVLTLLAGIKAIADQRQAKMQILIYQALESGKEIDSDRLREMGIKK